MDLKHSASDLFPKPDETILEILVDPEGSLVRSRVAVPVRVLTTCFATRLTGI